MVKNRWFCGLSRNHVQYVQWVGCGESNFSSILFSTTGIVKKRSAVDISPTSKPQGRLAVALPHYQFGAFASFLFSASQAACAFD